MAEDYNIGLKARKERFDNHTLEIIDLLQNLVKKSGNRANNHLSAQDAEKCFEFIGLLSSAKPKAVIESQLATTNIGAIELNIREDAIRDYEKIYRECKDFIINYLRSNNYSPEVPVYNEKTEKYEKNPTSGGIKHIPMELKFLIWYMAYRGMELYNDMTVLVSEYEKEYAKAVAKYEETCEKYKGITTKTALKQVQEAKVKLDIADKKRNLLKDWESGASSYIEKVTKKKRRFKGVSNQLILDYFLEDSVGNKGFKFSKKTLQDFALSPSRLYDALHYNNISLPYTYPGEKKTNHARAIRYLVAFARDFDNFLDLFGGSGRVSMLVQKFEGVDYYINEWNYTNINYYNCLRDNTLLALLKEYIKIRQRKLNTYNGRFSWRLSEKLLKSKESEFSSGTSQTYDVTGRALRDFSRGKVVSAEIKELWRDAFSSPNEINYRNLSDRQKMLWALAFMYYNSFCQQGGAPQEALSANKDYIDKLKKFKVTQLDLVNKELRWLREIYNTDALYGDEYLIEEFTDKAPRTYEALEDDIRAVRNGTYSGVYSKELLKSIRLLGGRIKKDNTTNAIEIKRYPRNFRTLIYCDSPYLNTEGYAGKKGKNNTVDVADGCINKESMENLITRLMNFYKEGNDFIFSCRPTVTRDNFYINDLVDLTIRDERHNLIPESFAPENVVKDKFAANFNEIKKRCKANSEIYYTVFEKFSSLAKDIEKPLNVLVELASGVDMENYIRTFQILEVYITSINAPSLPLNMSGEEGVLTEAMIRRAKTCQFKVYTLDKFLEVLQQNLYMSEHADKWDKVGNKIVIKD